MWFKFNFQKTLDNSKLLVNLSWKDIGVKRKEFEALNSQFLDVQGSTKFQLPPELLPFVNYPHNDEKFIPSTRQREDIKIKTYGEFNGHPFMISDITRENINEVLCIHDASHSVALFLTEKDVKKRVAIHNIVPWVFESSLPYTLYYSQKFKYPLITTELVISAKEMIEGQNVLFTPFKRYCTYAYKIRASRLVYKEFNLKGITQLKGMTKFQSSKRNKLYMGHQIDIVSDDTLLKKTKLGNATKQDYNKFFYCYQRLPIFEMTDQTIEEIIKKEGLIRNPPENILYYTFDGNTGIVDVERPHGCVMCPFRSKYWYHFLKRRFPDLYDYCNTLRLYSSTNRTNEYWYFYNPAIKPNGKVVGGDKIM